MRERPVVLARRRSRCAVRSGRAFRVPYAVLRLLVGPCDGPGKVAVPIELAREPFPGELDEHNLQTGGSRELHGRQAISVAGDEDYPVDGSVHGVGGDVRAEPHVDPLLFESGREISIR